MPEPLTLDTTAFVTFYSFKGGVGRSMALINVAGIMAGRGFRVLALDMDLEAPGISYLMRHEANLGKQHLPGFVDLLSDACARGEEADLFALAPEEVVNRYSYGYTLPSSIRTSEDGLLRIMPAGQFDGQYQKRLDALHLGQLYQDGVGQPLIAAFKEVLQRTRMFDFVLIDSRTGFSDESGICTRDLGDYLMVVMGLNRQNQEGTAEFLRSLRESGVIPRDLRVILSPVPNGEEELVEKREQEAVYALSVAYGKPVNLSLQIPYHPRLALTEEPHIFRRSRGYLYDAYIAIEREVMAVLGMTVADLREKIAKAAKARNIESVIHWLQRVRKLDGSSDTMESVIVGGELLDLCLQAESGTLRSYLSLALPGSSWIVRHLAIALDERKMADAEVFYQLAIKAGPRDANILGNYAIFLKNIRKDDDGAEALYKRALEADPESANNLGNYALFLTKIRKDDDGAEVLYKRALEADLKHVNNLGNYANFLTSRRGDHDGAEALYKRALEADPKDANILGNYAIFLKNIRKDQDGAEALYKRALEADPKHTNNLGGYASFLTNIRKDHDGAEALYKRAFEVDPKHANNLGNYANFRNNIRRDDDGAETLYKRALEADPKHANNLGNYSRFLFASSRTLEAEEMWTRAFALNSDLPPLVCELWFYACAHLWKQRPESLPTLKRLLLEGTNSPGWPLTDNVRVAREQGHPDPDFIEALARVVSAEAGIETLEKFEAWKLERFDAREA